jgi:hypothetical protein
MHYVLSAHNEGMKISLLPLSLSPPLSLYFQMGKRVY